jgi:hypothetical protein
VHRVHGYRDCAADPLDQLQICQRRDEISVGARVGVSLPALDRLLDQRIVVRICLYLEEQVRARIDEEAYANAIRRKDRMDLL